MSQSQPSADFVTAFADLARRLVTIDVTVETLKLYYGSFGSWELIATKGHEAVQFFYDGRDRYIQTKASPIREWSAPNQWAEADAKAVETGSEAICYAEEFLKEKFGKLSN